jgi:hypothetical protein
MNLTFNGLKSSNDDLKLTELVSTLEEQETYDNPDIVLEMNKLKMDDDMNVVIPEQGRYSLTTWSRSQISNMTGIRFDRWFQNATNAEKAYELNRRFDRAQGEIKVRTSSIATNGTNSDGTLKAFVSSGYIAISDALVGNLILNAINDKNISVLRASDTSRSFSYVIRMGKHDESDVSPTVGTILTGLQISNSGVGYASLSISLHLTRLVCSNGMLAPVAGATLLKRRHTGDPEMALFEQLPKVLQGIPDKLNQATYILNKAQDYRVHDPQQVIEDIIRKAKIPNKSIPYFKEAFQQEPIDTAFGVSQALTDSITHAKLGMSPEDKRLIEDVAGNYLRGIVAN